MYNDLDPFLNWTNSDGDDYKIPTCIATLKVAKGKIKKYNIQARV